MTQLLLLPLQIALALAPPALIARFAPRRWRLPLAVAWGLAPVLVGVGMAATEMLTGKPGDLDKLIFALLLIGSFVLLPWLIACAAGYALGAWWRTRREGPAAPAPRVASSAAPPTPTPAPYTPRVDPDAPSLYPRSGWQAAHVGFANDGLVLDGLPVWNLDWRAEAGAEAVTLPHPAHLGERHAFSVYNVDDGRRAKRFAATELSNGVWGFYRWIVPVAEVSGESDDGALRYTNDFGPEEDDRRPSTTAPTAQLHDARTGALLFDGAAWRLSRIVPQPDGGLLLVLEERDQQTLFLIDPADGTFRDLGFAGATPRPLAELAQAAADARAEAEAPANHAFGRRIAPDGTIKVELTWQEWGNSHWVRAPRVSEIATGRILLDLWNTDWDADASFPRRRTVRLSLRRYHHGGGAEVEIETGPDRYILMEGGGATMGELRALPDALAAAARRAAKAASARTPSPPPRPPVTARSWLVALGILAGALAAIAVATALTLRFERKPPPQRLDTIPAMPSSARAPDLGPRFDGDEKRQ